MNVFFSFIHSVVCLHHAEAGAWTQLDLIWVCAAHSHGSKTQDRRSQDEQFYALNWSSSFIGIKAQLKHRNCLLYKRGHSVGLRSGCYGELLTCLKNPVWNLLLGLSVSYACIIHVHVSSGSEHQKFIKCQSLFGELNGSCMFRPEPLYCEIQATLTLLWHIRCFSLRFLRIIHDHFLWTTALQLLQPCLHIRSDISFLGDFLPLTVWLSQRNRFTFPLQWYNGCN